MTVLQETSYHPANKFSWLTNIKHVVPDMTSATIQLYPSKRLNTFPSILSLE